MASPDTRPAQTTYFVILAVSLCHLLNDVMQSLLAAIYPILKTELALSFGQIGLLSFAFQVTASLLQPVVGIATDRRPFPRALPIGMTATMAGLGLLAFAPGYGTLLLGACLIGLGSAVFHPEASRVARLAAGGRFGMAQSVFQVGGNTGQAIGPLLAAFIVVPFGRGSIAWFAAAALGGIAILARVGAWYAATAAATARRAVPARELPLPRRRVVAAIGILVALVLAKTIYTSGVTSFYTFFLIERFGLGTQEAQVMLFLFLGAIAVGTVVGGPVADRIGAAPVIWSSAIGAIPLALALPYLGLAGTALVSVALGVVMAIAFPVIVVFAQQLLPGRVGLVSGIFFGLAFGMGGLAAAALGLLADRYGIVWIFEVTAFAPVVGLIALFLPRKRSFFPG